LRSADKLCEAVGNRPKHRSHYASTLSDQQSNFFVDLLNCFLFLHNLVFRIFRNSIHQFVQVLLFLKITLNEICPKRGILLTCFEKEEKLLLVLQVDGAITDQELANLNEIVCPDKEYVCPDNSTCCQLVSKGYGCCPLQDASCCADHMHCCPSGTSCDVAESRCVSVEVSLPCCGDEKRGFRCCPLINGICCITGNYCCPYGFQ
uniref:GRANULINS domain-containing protein n=1 Tax=Syphacia muris TaxID=451379 RepID=A0A0N5ABH9_9BILA